ncbi:MAG: hypothetical protein WDN72_05650 [Alphaproteobacteria bacterium]
MSGGTGLHVGPHRSGERPRDRRFSPAACRARASAALGLPDLPQIGDGSINLNAQLGFADHDVQAQARDVRRHRPRAEYPRAVVEQGAAGARQRQRHRPPARAATASRSTRRTCTRTAAASASGRRQARRAAHAAHRDPTSTISASTTR